MSSPQTPFIFQQTPDESDSRGGWTIKRADPSRSTALIAVSREWLGIRTHFWHNRTTPCRADGCEACDRGILSRWHGYLLTFQPKCKQRIVFEFTSSVHGVFADALDRTGSLYGFKFIASRVRDDKNAKVLISDKGYAALHEGLPKEQEVWPVLSVIFGLSKSVPTMSEIGAATILTPAEMVEQGNGKPKNGKDRCRRPHGINRLDAVLEDAFRAEQQEQF